MDIKHYFPGIVLSCCALLVFNCGEKKRTSEKTSFTKSDSLTESYLALQDSILQTWNMMINDDNQKIKAMHNLVHELMVTCKNENEELVPIEHRLEQLNTLRYNQETIDRTDIVEEYDFATSSVISEVISIAESRPEFTNSSILQKLVDSINEADQRVNTYREEYDYIILRYNAFLEKNKSYLKEIDSKSSLEKMPSFQMTMDDE